MNLKRGLQVLFYTLVVVVVGSILFLSKGRTLHYPCNLSPVVQISQNFSFRTWPTKTFGGRSLFSNVQTLQLNLSAIGEHSCEETQMRLDAGLPSHLQSFRPTVTEEERLAMLQTLRSFVQHCELHNLTYLLYGGSLLGSYRHHGLVPWDDDIDVMMNDSQRPLVQRILSSVPGYKLFTTPTIQWKFYMSEARKSPGKDFGWPYIDIFFFLENETHIWDRCPGYKDNFLYIKRSVFPLTLRPFEGFLVASPRDTAAVINTNYLTSRCSTGGYCHKHELSSTSQSVACSQLYHFYPFVSQASCRPGWITEVLTFRGKPQYALELPKP